MEPRKDKKVWIQWGLVSLLVVIVVILSGVLLKMTHELETLSPAVAAALAKNSASIPAEKTRDDAQKSAALPPVASDLSADPFNPDTWNPFAEMLRMQDDIQHMFTDAFGRFSKSPDYDKLVSTPEFSPNLDIQDKKDAYVLRLDLPGVDKGNVDVQVDGRKVTVSGERNNERTEKDAEGNIVRQERRTGRFSRTVLLPKPVNAEKMHADAQDGVYTITLPKASA